MKLFALRHSITRALVSNLYFRDKREAKAERDRLNQLGDDKYVVTPGPDHYKFKKL